MSHIFVLNLRMHHGDRYSISSPYNFSVYMQCIFLIVMSIYCSMIPLFYYFIYSLVPIACTGEPESPASFRCNYERSVK